MTPPFSVRPSPRFARLARQLTDQHPQEFPGRYAETIEILKADPTNRTGRYHIKKLKRVPPAKASGASRSAASASATTSRARSLSSSTAGSAARTYR